MSLTASRKSSVPIYVPKAVLLDLDFVYLFIFCQKRKKKSWMWKEVYHWYDVKEAQLQRKLLYRSHPFPVVHPKLCFWILI
jgi:hypothetical protein